MLRHLSALGLLTTALFAQSPLTTIYAWNNGGAAGWTMYFDLTVNVPVTINQIDTNSGSTASTAGTLDVYYTTTATTYVGNDTNPGAWTLGGQGPCVAAGLNLPTTCALTSAFTLSPGTYGIAVVHNGISPYYTDGTGTNQVYSNTELTLTAGASAGGGLGTAICCTPRVFNGSIHYTVSGGGTVATRTSYGSGCYSRYSSFYEHFTTTPSIDLSGTAFQMIPTGSGYVVIPATTAFVAPSASATNLNLGDDTETTVTLSAPFTYPGGTTSTLNVASNGHISTASNGAAGDYTPTPAEFLAWTNPTWSVWRDFICNATGNVKFEEVAGTAYITWDGVIGYVGTVAGTTPSTFQVQFSLTTGIVNFVFQSMDTVSVSGWAGGEGWVVGYSAAGANGNPGSTDISALTSVTLGTTDTAPLTLAASARPLVGTTINLNTTNVTGSNIGVTFLSAAQIPAPGVDLGIIGAPGCAALVDVNVGFGAVIGNVLGLSLSAPFSIPATAPLGFQVYCQSIWLDATQNAFGLLSSNGVALTLGNL